MGEGEKVQMETALRKGSRQPDVESQTAKEPPATQDPRRAGIAMQWLNTSTIRHHEGLAL
jgi:hypothetical protein